jgi:hypothetical protein
MVENRQRRAFSLIALIAIGLALVLFVGLMLAPPQGNSGSPDFVAILPLLLVGIVSPLSLLGLVVFVYAARVPQAPVLAPTFQRPPPLRRS